MKLKISFIGITLLLCLNQISAESKTWIGVNTNWNESDNWNPSGVPNETDDVIFDATSVNCDIQEDIIVGSFTINSTYAGTVNVIGNGTEIQLSSGDFDISYGGFDSGSGNITFAGSNQQWIKFPSNFIFHHINNAKSGSHLEFTNTSSSINKLKALPKTETRLPVVLTEVNELEFIGSSGNELSIRCISPNISARLKVTGSQTISYSDFSYIDASYGDSIIASDGTNIDSGNNYNILFNGNISIWTGDALNDIKWSTAENWLNNIVPGALDIVIFDGSEDCIIDKNIEVKSFIVKNGYTGTISGNSAMITINTGDFDISHGGFSSGTSTIKFTGNDVVQELSFPDYFVFHNIENAQTGSSSYLTWVDSWSVINQFAAREGTDTRLSVKTTTIASLDLNGATGNELVLTSFSPNINARINFQGSVGQQSISSVNFSKIDANYGNAIDATDNCVDNGNNSNIIFTGRIAVWTGQGVDDRWSTDENWRDNLKPDVSDSVCFDGSFGNKDCIINDHIEIKSLIINSNYTGIVSGNSAIITINKGDFNIQNGKFNAESSTIKFTGSEYQSLRYPSGFVLNSVLNAKIGSYLDFNYDSLVVNKFKAYAGTETHLPYLPFELKVNHLEINGDNGNLAILKSRSSSMNAGIVFMDTDSISYTDFYMITNTGLPIDAADNCIDSGNNQNIVFKGVRIWDGEAGDNLFSSVDNWSDNILPKSTDLLYFTNVSSSNCIIDIANLTIAEITITEGYGGTLDFGTGFVNLREDLTQTSGNIDASNATVVLNGTGKQFIRTYQEVPYKNLIINNNSDVISFKESGFTANEFELHAGSFTEIGSGLIVTTTSITANGTDSDEIHLRAGNQSAPWKLNVLGNTNVSYIHVQGSDASGGIEIDAQNYCIDGSNNNNWNFGTNIEASEIIYVPNNIAFTTDVLISLSATPSTNVTIHFTTDGSDPTVNSSVYTSPFTVSETTDIHAVAVTNEGDSEEVISQVFGKKYYQVLDEGEMYVRKSYGMGAIVKSGEVRRFEGQVWWVGPDGEPDEMSGDDVRLPEYDDDIIWSATGGTIVKTTSTMNGGSAVFTSDGTTSSYTVTLTFGPNSFIGCNNSKPDGISATRCNNGCVEEKIKCVGDSNANSTCVEDWVPVTGCSPIPMPTIGKEVSLHVTNYSGAYNVTPFSFSHAARCSDLHELRVIGDTIYILWIKYQSISNLSYKKGADGNFYFSGGGANYVESLSSGGYKYHHWDGSSFKFSYQINQVDNHYLVTEYLDKNGNLISYDYQSENLLVIKDASLNTYEIHANTAIDGINVIDKIVTKPAGSSLEKTWSFGYDSRGFLAYERYENIYEDSNITYSDYIFKFDDHGNLISFIDYRGLEEQHFYDNSWRWLKTINRDGSIEDNERTSPNGLYERTNIDPLGHKTVVTFTQGGYILPIKEVKADGLEVITEYVPGTPYVRREIQNFPDQSFNNIVTDYEYDENFYKSKKTVDVGGLNHITIYENDDQGNVTKITDPNGVITEFIFDANNRLIKKIIDVGGLNLITEKVYDTLGNKIKEIDELGKEKYWSYDEFSRIIGTTDALGNEEYYTYDVWGNKSSFTDKNGNTTTYEYDALNRLIKTTDPQGYEEMTEYDGNDNKIRFTDKNGSVTVYDYNNLDQNIKVYGDANAPGGCGTCGGTAANGKEGDYDYDWKGNITKFTDIEGLVTVYEYDNMYRKIREVKDPYDEINNPTGLNIEIQWEYDLLGRKTKEIKVNNSDLTKNIITEYVYDKANRLIETKKHIGDETFDAYYEYDNMHHIVATTDENGYVSFKQYDNAYRIVSTTDAEGLVIENFYNDRSELIKRVLDPSGFSYTTSYEYDDASRLIKTTEADGGVVIQTWDDHGNLLTLTDPNNNTMEYTYDSRHNLISTTDSGGFITSFSYDGLGNRTSVTDAQGMITSYTYDDKSFVTSIIKDQGGISANTTFTRDMLVNPTVSTDAFGTVSETVYDTIYRPIMTIADANGYSVTNEVFYDSLNRVIKKKNPGDFETIYEFDQLNRLIKQTMPDGGETTYTYDNRNNILTKTHKVDGNNSLITKYEYDKKYRLTKTIEDFGGKAITTTRTYDVLGRLTTITDSNSNSTSYTYDEENRILTETFADGGVITKTYDLKGRLLTRLDQNGELCTYTYDNRDLLIQKDYANNGIQTFEYDSLRRLTKDTDNNENTQLVMNEYTYDKLHRNLTAKQTIGSSPAQTLTKTFDAYGHEITCQHPNGRVVEFSYTALHQVDQVKTTSGAGTVVVADYKYEYEDVDADKRAILIEQQLHSDTSITGYLEYDQMNRLTKKDWRQSAVSLVGFDYTYDLYGNRLTDTHLHNSSDSETYSYDSAQRVDGYDRDSGFAQNWQLDDLGNWTQFDNNGSIESRTHNEVNEIVSITPQTSITHDTNGNMTWDGERSLEWDGLNRLIRVSGNVGTIAKYYYNAMNMRVQKHIDTDNDGLLDDKTNYIYCHQKVCVEQDENGNLKKDYVHGGQYIDQVLMESDSSTSLGSYYLTDLRYSIYAVVDNDGVVTERYRYDAYGKRDVMTATFVLTGADAETEFGYTGRRHDVEDTGLMYFRARYYSPELGRFVGRDPLGTALDVNYMNKKNMLFAALNYSWGMNLYRAYFAPNYTDPSGRGLQEIINAISAAIDAYNAAMDCIGAINDAFDQLGAISNDALAHCVASCNISNNCGATIADTLGTIKEARDLFIGGVEWTLSWVIPESWENWISDTLQGGSFQNSVDDFYANFTGLSCSADGGDNCQCCCEKQFGTEP